MSLYGTIDIRFADPVSAISMNNNFIVTGSMMGRVALYNVQTKKTTLLSELSSENITGINFENDILCNISVGDEEVLKYKFDTIGNNHDFKRYPNYENENIHKNKCESMFALLNYNKLLLVELNQQSDTGNININTAPTPLKIKDITNGEISEYQVVMTNYSVPFDFTGLKFLWVEFLSDKERSICLFDFESQNKYEYSLNKDFGHISFARIYNDDTIILVKNLNVVEVRSVDENFTLRHTFKSIGDEVIAMDIYLKDNSLISSNIVDINKNNNVNSINNVDNNKISKLDVKTNVKDKEDNNIMYLQKEQELAEKKEIVNVKKVNDDKKINMLENVGKNSNLTLTIVLVDIDGNVNVIEDFKKLETKFNMYQIKDIPQDIKEKQFFSMGYPYYINANQNFYVVSTDYGVYVFQINKNLNS